MCLAGSLLRVRTVPSDCAHKAALLVTDVCGACGALLCQALQRWCRGGMQLALCASECACSRLRCVQRGSTVQRHHAGEKHIPWSRGVCASCECSPQRSSEQTNKRTNDPALRLLRLGTQMAPTYGLNLYCYSHHFCAARWRVCCVADVHGLPATAALPLHSPAAAPTPAHSR